MQNESIPDARGPVFCGVDTHADSHWHEMRRPEDTSALVAARRAAKVSQVRAASILGTSEKYISMLERGQRELKPIRRAYEAWVEAGLPLDWDRQAFEAERKMDSKKHLAK